MKVIFTLTLILGLKFVVFSQKTDTREIVNRNSFWTETVFNGVIKNKFKWQLDYQYRRTSDPSDLSAKAGYSTNLFKNDFQHVYRPWIHYQINDNVRVSLSPLGFWETYTSSLESGSTRKVQPEYRICPQLTLTNKIWDRVIIDQRYRYEFRYIGTKVTTTKPEFTDYQLGTDFPDAGRKMRMRYFLRATVPLNHKKLEKNTFYIVSWNEIFIGLGKNTANDKIWDQNRSFCLLGYKTNTEFPMRFEIGYSVIYKNAFTSSVNSAGQLYETNNKIEKNNILQVYLIFENVNKLFSFKSKEKIVDPLK
jgi:hypothetical protein